METLDIFLQEYNLESLPGNSEERIILIQKLRHYPGFMNSARPSKIIDFIQAEFIDYCLLCEHVSKCFWLAALRYWSPSNLDLLISRVPFPCREMTYNKSISYLKFCSESSWIWIKEKRFSSREIVADHNPNPLWVRFLVDLGNYEAIGDLFSGDGLSCNFFTANEGLTIEEYRKLWKIARREHPDIQMDARILQGEAHMNSTRAFYQFLRRDHPDVYYDLDVNFDHPSDNNNLGMTHLELVQYWRDIMASGESDRFTRWDVEDLSYDNERWHLSCLVIPPGTSWEDLDLLLEFCNERRNIWRSVITMEIGDDYQEDCYVKRIDALRFVDRYYEGDSLGEKMVEMLSGTRTHSLIFNLGPLSRSHPELFWNVIQLSGRDVDPLDILRHTSKEGIRWLVANTRFFLDSEILNGELCYELTKLGLLDLLPLISPNARVVEEQVFRGEAINGRLGDYDHLDLSVDLLDHIRFFWQNGREGIMGMEYLCERYHHLLPGLVSQLTQDVLANEDIPGCSCVIGDAMATLCLVGHKYHPEEMRDFTRMYCRATIDEICDIDNYTNLEYVMQLLRVYLCMELSWNEFIKILYACTMKANKWMQEMVLRTDIELSENFYEPNHRPNNLELRNLLRGESSRKAKINNLIDRKRMYTHLILEDDCVVILCGGHLWDGAEYLDDDQLLQILPFADAAADAFQDLKERMCQKYLIDGILAPRYCMTRKKSARK